jgi:DNA-binding transcriptional MocR family regulator
VTEDGSAVTLESTLRNLARTLEPGARLPSVREIVERHQVSPVTVGKVVARLSAAGVLVTRPGSGTFVAAPPARARARRPDTAWQSLVLAGRSVDIGALREVPRDPDTGTISLSGGYLHRSLQPVRALASAMSRAARRPDAWDRAPAGGLPELRSYFAEATAADVGLDDVLITTGGQNALAMAFRAIGAPGDAVLVESPTYPGALAAIAAARLRAIPIPLGPDGIDPDDVRHAFARTGAQLLYCQPTFHNPTGIVLSESRRQAVLEVVHAARAFIVEDDYARHLSHDGGVARSLLGHDVHGSVIQVTSLTKPAAPSLRVGAIVARGPVAERLQASRRVDDFFVSRPMQEAALELTSSPHWAKHLNGLKRALRHRHRILSDALRMHLPEWEPMPGNGGGLYLWVRLPSNADPAEMVRRASEQGVDIESGQRFFPAEADGRFVRLSFAAAVDSVALEEAVDRLAPIGAGR